MGAPAGTVAENLLNAFDEDVITEYAQRVTGTAAPTEDERKQAQKELLKSAVAPFHIPEVRDYIENVRRSHDQIIDNVNLDSVLFAGFDAQQEANVNKILSDFRAFIEENKDEIVALRIIYDAAYKDRPMVIEKLKELYEKLKSHGITVERDVYKRQRLAVRRCLISYVNTSPSFYIRKLLSNQ